MQGIQSCNASQCIVQSDVMNFARTIIHVIMSSLLISMFILMSARVWLSYGLR